MEQKEKKVRHLNVKTGLYGLSPEQKKGYQIFRFCLPVPFAIVLILTHMFYMNFFPHDGLLKFVFNIILFAAGYWLFSVLCVRFSEFILSDRKPEFSMKILWDMLKNPDNFRKSRNQDEFSWILIFFFGACGIAFLVLLIITNLAALPSKNDPSVGAMFSTIGNFLMGLVYGAFVLSALLPFYMVLVMKYLFKGMVNLSLRPEENYASISYPHFAALSFSAGVFTVLMLWAGGGADSWGNELLIVSREVIQALPWALALYVNLFWCETFVFNSIHSLPDKEKERNKDKDKEKEIDPAKQRSALPKLPQES